jgi:glycosyltransferase involved in cell wall biosynthesis
LPTILETYPDVTCLMIGDGDSDYIESVRTSARRFGSVIHWMGYRANVAALLRECVVLICPSEREALGRVILEAWDTGAVPVAFSGSGGAAEVIAAADGGILYDAQEPTSLAQAVIAALALGDAERTRLVRNGQEWLAANCTPAAYGNTLNRFLEACAE